MAPDYEYRGRALLAFLKGNMTPLRRTPSRTLPRRVPQQRRASITRDAIIEAAAHLLATRGWEASTTNHIAARAGVSIGSLYKYFPNKPSIVAEVARRRIEAEVIAIAATLEQHAEDPLGMPAAIVTTTADRYAENAALDTALMEQLGAIEVARFLRDCEAAVVRVTERYLTRHRRKLRTGQGAAAFVAVHTLRGVLVAAAAHEPALLLSAAFRSELVLLLERYLRHEVRGAGPKK
jgi:AcrR family transcriptional regulator